MPDLSSGGEERALGTVGVDVATMRAAGGLLNAAGPRPDDGAFADIDIAALGQLIEAIVLFDEVVVPALGHRLNVAGITALFGPAVRLQPIETTTMHEVTEESQHWLKYSQDVNLEALIQLIGCKPEFDRIVRSSDSDQLLLASVGVHDKYSLAAADWVRTIRPPDDPGQLGVRGYLAQQWYQFKKRNKWGAAHHDVPDDMMGFCTKLAWLTVRARSYDLLCRRMAVPYLPHPLRTSIAGFASFTDDAPAVAEENRALSRYERTRKPLVFSYLDAIRNVYQESMTTISEALGAIFVPMRCSLLLPHVISKAGTRKNIVEAAYEVRDQRGARSLRSHLAQLEPSIAAGDLKSALKLVRELDRLTNSLRRELGLTAVQTPGMAVSIGGIASVQLPPDQVARLTATLTRRITFARPRVRFLRNVFKDLADAADLGPLYEVLYRKA